MATGWGQVNGDTLSSPRKRPRTDGMSKVTVVLGAQWGDEGKGKVVDMLATHSDMVCRCQVCIYLLHMCCVTQFTVNSLFNKVFLLI